MSVGQGYNCNICDIFFENESEYKIHYKSEFHIYNVKRKVINIKPVSYEQFEHQFYENSSQNTSMTCNLYCQPCCRQFCSKASYNQHINSKKHLSKQKNFINKAFSDDVEVIKDTTLDNSSICLFCQKLLQNIDENLKHMKESHGFFIQLQEKCIRKDQLIQKLGRQIYKEFECINCFQHFDDYQSAQQHMISKGHCFMQDELYEYLDYYKFDSDSETFEIIKEEDDEIEDLNIEKAQRYQDFLNREVTLLNTNEIQLSNGKIIGTREFKNLYKQNPIIKDKEEQIKTLLGDKIYEIRQNKIEMVKQIEKKNQQLEFMKGFRSTEGQFQEKQYASKQKLQLKIQQKHQKKVPIQNKNL